ncbi:transposase, partial [Staphylococcus aureus]
MVANLRSARVERCQAKNGCDELKAQINQKLSEPETKKIYSQRKIDVEPVFGFMKAILGFTRMSVRGINKVKRELG